MTPFDAYLDRLNAVLEISLLPLPDRRSRRPELVVRVARLICAQRGRRYLNGGAGPTLASLVRAYDIDRQIAEAALGLLRRLSILQHEPWRGFFFPANSTADLSNPPPLGRLDAVTKWATPWSHESSIAREELLSPRHYEPSRSAAVSNIDLFFLHLNAQVPGVLESRLRSYFHEQPYSKWIIASDYCVKSPNRRSDVYVFTLIPCNVTNIESIAADIRTHLPRDLKDSKAISSQTCAFLRSEHRFTVAFVVERGSRILHGDVATARTALDNTIKMMESWPNARRHSEAIRRHRMLRNEANAKAFNLGLLNRTSLASIFGAFCYYLISKYGRNVEVVCWFPDRDAITTWMDGIGYDMFHTNTASFAERGGASTDIDTAFATYREAASELWYDDFIRIPDHFAGPLASLGWNKETSQTHFVLGNEPATTSTKYRTLLLDVIADNPNVAAFSVDLRNEGDVRVSRLLISRDAPDPKVAALDSAKPTATKVG